MEREEGQDGVFFGSGHDMVMDGMFRDSASSPPFKTCVKISSKRQAHFLASSCLIHFGNVGGFANGPFARKSLQG